MADVEILASQVEAAPLDYAIPGGQEILLKVLAASFDGSSAAGLWQPAVQIVGPSGQVLRTFPVTTPLAAGASADVTWFPRGGVSARGTPPVPAGDYVFRHTNLSVTGVGFSNGTTLLTGNPITLDGATRIKIEIYAPIVEILNGDKNQAIGFELYDGVADKGTFGYIEGGNTPVLNSVAGSPFYAIIIDTPIAGVHTYAVKVFKNDASGTCTVFASTFVDGSGSVGPAWLRVTAT